MGLKERKEIQDKFKWDISSIYSDMETWEADYKRVNNIMSEFSNLKGSILDSSDSFYKAIKLFEKGDRILTNVVTYSFLKRDEDTSNNKSLEYAARSQQLATEFSKITSFFIPEIIEKDKSIVDKYISEKKELNLYKQYIDNIFRSKKYILSEREEEILAMSSDIGTVPNDVFGTLNSSDFIFPYTTDEDGKEVQLSHGSFIPLMESKNRKVRKEAFEKYYSVFEQYQNTLANLVYSEVKKNIFYAKVRKHENARSAAIFQNNIPSSVYDNLIEAVHNNLEPMHKYMRLRKKILALDELHMYDLYTPMIKNYDMKVSFDEAKETVIETLGILGEEYKNTVKGSFEEGWIDVYENKGKRSGAYSWGNYDSKPFILLNYHDTLDNMFTLIHEMGHSMHSYLTHKNQEYVYGNYSIFLAEVASTTNESLLMNHLLKNSKSKEEKLYLLNHYLDQFRGTVYRQTMFAEFERDIHTVVENGGALTAEKLKELYRNLNIKYYGKDMIIDKQIDVEWARIPHFYFNFYVYQYATGFSAAIALSNAIINEGQPAVERYTEFLSAGSSKYPIEILRKAGADMETKAPVESALKLFGKLVDEMEDLTNE
ncbi:oligoendopeptidase F [Helicovermis profundi]|uniref:Oligopeptidase F n=1 Tax=Helicovermis profundi TaxID=3065157 RepID=A0AAU9E2F4_9FIRM|nr:oligoendopeptidase F [Clostridia bacterium S502]